MEYLFDIERTTGGLVAQMHIDGAAARALPSPRLNETDEVAIKGRPIALGKLVAALVRYDRNDLQLAFDDRGQLELGRHLYAQLFPDPPRTAEPIRVRIRTHDEHIARLPWALLADSVGFRTPAGWSVVITGRDDRVPVEIPPAPRLLVVAPHPVGVPPTQADRHIEGLENLLSARAPLLRRGRNLLVVGTWEDYREQCAAFGPDLVYYYGHGQADGMESTYLLFAGRQGNALDRRPVADFAQVLRNLPRPPALVYVNCCQGDAGGDLGVGRLLESFVPAVITNRTVAMIEAAQGQAMALWEGLLLKGEAPDAALALLYSRKIGPDVKADDVRWMTPVLHGHYSEWRANVPPPLERDVYDPFWHLKVDRVEQVGVVMGQARQMLREGKPKAHAFLWYGEPGEGVDTFHNRLDKELRADNPENPIWSIYPRWPDELVTPHRSFSDMICEACEVSELEDISAKFRHQSGGGTGKRTLLYLRHQPLRKGSVVGTVDIRPYLEWLDTTLLPLLERGQFVLVGVSFETAKPANLFEIVTKKARLEEAHFDRLVFRLLSQFRPVELRDLHLFLQTHSIRLPLDRKERVLKEIIDRTQGNYEATVEELKHLLDLAWLREEPTATGGGDGPDWGDI